MAKITFWKGTLAQYAAKKAANQLDENRLYFIEEAAATGDNLKISGVVGECADMNGSYVLVERNDEVPTLWENANGCSIIVTPAGFLELQSAAFGGIASSGEAEFPGTAAGVINGAASLVHDADGLDNMVISMDDSPLLGSLYKGKTLIAPQRLGELTVGTKDEDKVPTAKAVAEFVASFFAEGSAYEEAIKGITDRLDAAEGRLDTAEGDIDNLEGRMDTAEGDIDALKGRVKTTEDLLAGFSVSAGITVTGTDYDGDYTPYDANATGADRSFVGPADEDGYVSCTIRYDEDNQWWALNSDGTDMFWANVSTDATVEEICAALTSAANTQGATDALFTAAAGNVKAVMDTKADKANVYTKEEIKNMLSSALEFKGTVETVAGLPATGETGDLYYVKEASKEYVFIEEGDAGHWEELGGVVDYSVFVQKTTKVNGKALSEDITLTGDDIKVGTFDTEGAVTTIGGETTLSGAIKALDEAISGVTGGSGGEGGSLASKMDKVSADAADQILTASSTGNAAASGYKVGGETFGETAKANTVATEAAVMAALKATNDEVAGKMSLVASAVDGNIVAMDANGDSKNSGFSISSAETIADVANASATKLVNEKAVATAIANATIEWIEG